MSLDVLRTSKYVWKEMLKLGLHLTVKDSVSIVRKNNELSNLANESLELIRGLRDKLIHVGKTYTIQCPKCGVKYTLGISELNLWHDVRCQDCGETYNQSNNIKFITCETKELQEIIFTCSRFLKFVEDKYRK